jgi:hypothetical protein
MNHNAASSSVSRTFGTEPVMVFAFLTSLFCRHNVGDKLRDGTARALRAQRP